MHGVIKSFSEQTFRKQSDPYSSSGSMKALNCYLECLLCPVIHWAAGESQLCSSRAGLPAPGHVRTHVVKNILSLKTKFKVQYNMNIYYLQKHWWHCCTHREKEFFSPRKLIFAFFSSWQMVAAVELARDWRCLWRRLTFTCDCS